MNVLQIQNVWKTYAGNVPITPDGGLSFQDGVSGPGKYVEMQARMDVITLISNCPQLNNPCSGFNPTPLDIIIWN